MVAGLFSFEASGQEPNNSTINKAISNPKYDAEAAKRLGADQRGMRSYVLVVLKTGPNKVAPGKERDEMFAGHFANKKR